MVKLNNWIKNPTTIEVTNKRNKAQEELDKLYARWEELELINGE